MIKQIIIFFTALMTSGCFYQAVSSGDMLMADLYCSGRGGINRITAHFTGIETVECNDGSESITADIRKQYDKHIFKQL